MLQICWLRLDESLKIRIADSKSWSVRICLLIYLWQNLENLEKLTFCISYNDRYADKTAIHSQLFFLYAILSFLFIANSKIFSLCLSNSDFFSEWKLCANYKIHWRLSFLPLAIESNIKYSIFFPFFDKDIFQASFYGFFFKADGLHSGWSMTGLIVVKYSQPSVFFLIWLG